MAVKTLGPLLNDSIDFCKRRFAVLLVGAALFGVVSQGVSWFLVGSAAVQWSGAMAPLMQQENNPRMQELMQKMQSGQGTQQDAQELAAMGSDAFNAMPKGQLIGLFTRMLPALGLAFFIIAIVGLFAKAYFVTVAVKDIGDAGTAINMTLANLLALIGMFFWVMLRSFIWIPFLGIILAIILGPRFILSPLYLLEQKKGVTESVRLSYDATAGWWGKIFGNLFVAGILSAIFSGILNKIIVAVLGSLTGGFVAAIVSQLMAAFMTVFAIHLGRTLMENRKKA